MRRTPPPTASPLSGSRSESDLLQQGESISVSDLNITTRTKRQRVETSPGNSSKQSASHSDDIRTDILNMLSSWKEDQDQRLNEWKKDLDNTLSRVVTEVSYLKKECLEIKKANSEMEKGIEFINKSYEETTYKVAEIEKGKNTNTEAIKRLETQIEDLHFRTRQATIEVRNVPLSENETHDNLLAIMSMIGKAMEINLNPGDLRDIYRLPGKQGTTRPIVAEFACVYARNELIAKVRRHNKSRTVSEKLNTQTIGLPGSKTPIYVDEYLPPSLRKLMYETRQFAKNHGYSCWHSHGKIFLRLDSSGKPILIKSVKCLAEILKKT